MRSSNLLAALFWGLAFSAMSGAEDAVTPAVDRVQSAFDRFVEAASRTDRPAELEAREARSLWARMSFRSSRKPLGDIASHMSGVRAMSCSHSRLLTTSGRPMRSIRHGMLDENPGIRYYSAASLGELRAQQAEPALRAALERANEKRDPIRFTLAEALARHGKADVLPVLIDAVSDEAYAWRNLGNVGLKALSGKSLEDFDAYDCREGAYTSGGTFSMPLDALTSAERKAGRFRAATTYLKWLKTERPELYRSANYRPRPRRAAVSR